MDFLFVNTRELSALVGLPSIQQVTYLMGIRPYMDRKTLIVGIKRRISYQSLSEALYVEPHPGIKSGSPSRQQLRRAIKSLERAGLLQIQSSDKNLILKCLLANSDSSAKNKPDTIPTPHANTKPDGKNRFLSIDCEESPQIIDINQTVKADTPHNSKENLVFLGKKFETFWTTYPQPQNKSKAWEEFQKLNPDDVLFSKLLDALKAQINHYQQQQAAGHWVPHWKYPDNWLSQRAWEHEIKTTEENTFGNYQKRDSSARPIDPLWDSCKAGAKYLMSKRNHNAPRTP